MRLEQCYVAAPVCSPARAALLTGRLPFRYGIDSHLGEGSTIYLSTREITVPGCSRASVTLPATSASGT